MEKYKVLLDIIRKCEVAVSDNDKKLGLKNQEFLDFVIKYLQDSKRGLYTFGTIDSNELENERWYAIMDLHSNYIKKNENRNFKISFVRFDDHFEAYINRLIRTLDKIRIGEEVNILKKKFTIGFLKDFKYEVTNRALSENVIDEPFAYA